MKPGTWARVALTNNGGQRITLRMAALAHERGGQWFEFSYGGDTPTPVVLKTLLDGRLEQPKRTLEALVQIGAQVPIALPVKLLAKQIPSFAREPQRTDGEGGAHLVGKERVKVAAGTFVARHYRRTLEGGKREDLWLSDQVPGWPLVKLVRPDLALELVGHGRDAKSELRGRPVDLSPSLLDHMDAIPAP